MIVLELIGSPIPQARPRFFSRKGFVGAYNPKAEQKRSVEYQIIQQFSGKPLECAVMIEMVFFMPIPISLSKKKKEKMENGEILHDKKPDIDNLQKFVLDCLNKIVIRDDSQVIEIIARKRYSFSPKTIINIYPLTSLDCTIRKCHKLITTDQLLCI